MWPDLSEPANIGRFYGGVTNPFSQIRIFITNHRVELPRIHTAGLRGMDSGANIHNEINIRNLGTVETTPFNYFTNFGD